jgi:hypothetical protein
MNKAKSLKFPLQSEPCPLFFARQVKEIVEWAEILFWHSFIHLATTLQRRQQTSDAWQNQPLAGRKLSHWLGYALFSALSLLSGVLIGFFVGHFF